MISFGLHVVWMAVVSRLPLLDIAEPEVTPDAVVLRLGGGTATLKNAEIHSSGTQLIVFVPGVSARAAKHGLMTGPLHTIQINPRSKGTAIILATVGSAAEFSKNLKINSSDPASIELVYEKPSKDTLAVLPNAKEKVVNVVPQGISARPTKDRPFWETMPTTTKTEHTTTWSMAVIFGCLLVGVAVFLFARHRSARIPLGVSIDVVAMKSLGGGHRLALIDACGDRFLLATSDKDVRLLSQLTGKAAAKPENFSQVLTDEQNVYRESVKPADIAGLLRLRTYAQNKEVAA